MLYISLFFGQLNGQILGFGNDIVHIGEDQFELVDEFLWVWHFLEFDSFQKRVGEQLLHLLGTVDLLGAVTDDNNIIQVVGVELCRQFKESVLLPLQHLLGLLGLELLSSADDFHLVQQLHRLRQPFVTRLVHPVFYCIRDQDHLAVFK